MGFEQNDPTRPLPLADLPGADSEAMRLISSAFDGTATRTDLDALERLLEDPAMLRVYMAMAEQHAGLAWRARWRAGPDADFLRGFIAPAVPGDPVPGDSASGSPSRGRRAARVAVALATATLALLGAFVAWRAGDGARGRNAAARIATVTALDNAQWDGPRQFAVGDPLASGPVRLLDGRAQLRFDSGATVTLNGKTELEIVNGRRVFLRSGRITPFVPPTAHGFTVVSPGGEVVDLGTEFAVGVDEAGRTNVYVIDGKVDVASGHASSRQPLRMTQGFGARLLAPSIDVPDLTQSPIVIDHFDIDRSKARPATAGESLLRWTDLTQGWPARVDEGRLVIPFADDPAWSEPAVQIRLDNDFSRLVGRRSTIAYKVTFPPGGTAGVKRWLALVFDGGAEGSEPEEMPLAQSDEAVVAVMASPVWQAGVRLRGQRLPCGPIFRRDEDATGPYQFVVSIDDSPEGRIENGGTRVDVMVNGVEFATNKIIELGDHPRLAFNTYLPRGKGWQGDAVAIVDDFSVSIEVDRPADAAAGGRP